MLELRAKFVILCLLVVGSFSQCIALQNGLDVISQRLKDFYLEEDLIKHLHNNLEINNEILGQNLGDSFQDLIVNLLHIPLSVSNLNLTEACRKTIPYLLGLLNPDNEDMIHLIDAWGKPQSGILEGNGNWLGGFKECMNFRSQVNVTGENKTIVTMDYSTEYCMINFTFNDIPMIPPIKQGVCIPSVCSYREVYDYFQSTATLTKVTFDQSTCQVKQDHSVDKTTIAVIVVWSVIGVLMLASTVYDVIFRYRRSGSSSDHQVEVAYGNIQTPYERSATHRLLLSFSVLTNGEKILSLEKSAESLGALHGLRFLSMAWVILGHSFMIVVTQPVSNPTWMYKVTTDKLIDLVFNAFLSVDSFFFLSGFLVSYLFYKAMKKSNGRFNILLYYIHRYFRLTIPLFMTIAWLATFAYSMTSGPFISSIGEQTNRDLCRKNWWKDVTYLNNLIKETEGGCVPVAWYLAADMQMFILTPFILYPLYRWPKVGYGLLGLALSSSIIVPMVITAHYDIQASILATVETATLNDYMKYYYVTPWCRSGPYVVGMIVGYIIAHLGTNIKLNKITLTVGWLLNTACALAIVFGIYRQINIDDYKVASKAERVAYNGLCRVGWGVVMGWITFTCVTGQGGIVDSILSWRGFLPLSRLTYCTYLIHYTIINSFAMDFKENVYFDHFYLVIVYLGIIVISFGMAFFVSLAFESPFVVIDSVVMGMFTGGNRNKSSPVNNEPPPPYNNADDVIEYDNVLPRINNRRSESVHGNNDIPKTSL